ncbi:MAG TPA: glycerol-3-phosphate 1-O-acyltransferase PlsY [Gemmatimonadaceae bacterium]|nr:glycerol-3-phosphate 1-O-acyltransferase PlsY [Gemmatimonadaceae bacterium]
MSPFLGLVLAYVAGSVPAAYIAGKVTRGIDLRQHGSGNLGATNVYRVLGAKVAIVVLLFDAAKGAVPVRWFPAWFDVPQTDAQTAMLWAIAYGVAAIVGHVRPVFLLWKGGGKGVATASGVFGALAPAAIGITLLVWFAVLVVSGYMSLASLAGAAVLPIAIAVLRGIRSPLFVVSVFVAAFVFWTHRTNIGRLRRGEEPRFGRKKPPES